MSISLHAHIPCQYAAVKIIERLHDTNYFLIDVRHFRVTFISCKSKVSFKLLTSYLLTIISVHSTLTHQKIARTAFTHQTFARNDNCSLIRHLLTTIITHPTFARNDNCSLIRHLLTTIINHPTFARNDNCSLIRHLLTTIITHPTFARNDNSSLIRH